VLLGDASPLLIRIISILRTRRNVGCYRHQNDKESHGVTFALTHQARASLFVPVAEQILAFRDCPSMTDDNKNPLLQIGLERAIGLRWTLRDIKAKRLKMSPISAADLSTLIDLGLVEMRENVPGLTNAGHGVLD
jgi:hypothetical protein